MVWSLGVQDWMCPLLSLQDEQKCVETVELGSYEKCQELRALLKRKHRFILLRSPGNKVGLAQPGLWELNWKGPVGAYAAER